MSSRRSFARFIRRGKGATFAAVTGLLLSSLTTVAGLGSATSLAAVRAAVAQPSPVPRQSTHPDGLPVDATRAASKWKLPTVAFPAAGVSTVAVGSTAVASAGVLKVAAPSALGTLGLPALPTHAAVGAAGANAAHTPTWAASSDVAPPGTVRVETLGAQARKAVGDAPMVFSVSRADHTAQAGPVAVSIDYSGFRDAFGGNYADRLALYRYPACVLTTPELPECSTATPVADQLNNPYQTSLTAVIDADPDATATSLPGTAPAAGVQGDVVAPALTVPAPTATATDTSSPSATTAPAPTDSPAPSPTDATNAVSSPTSVFVVSAAATGSMGSYVASPLNISSTWSVGLQSGTLNYSYPITVPPSTGGEAPRVALDYDSGSVDGRTSSTNPQASWLGLGWDYQPGFIEREYDSCDRQPNGSLPDLCYVTTHQNVTLSLDGRDLHLILDASNGTWRIQDDPGWQVSRFATGASLNDDANGEYWKLQSPDGTTYYFGRGVGRTGTGQTLTHSVDTVPIYNYDSTCPANLPTYCKKAWRWNLDYVVDSNGNATTYYYAQELNAYKVHSGGSAITYVRGSYPTEVTYGYRTGDALTTITDRVDFTYSGRCTANADSSGNACPTLGPANATSYPDVPTDLVCVSGSVTCTQVSPTFFSTVMLTNIKTGVHPTAGWTDLDSYDFQLDFPDPDGTGPESPTLWLAQVQHTGLDGTPHVSMPAMLTYGVSLPNRFDVAAGVSPVDQYRVAEITNETGGDIAVNYDTPDPCTSALMSGDHSHDNLDCFPVHWVPKGSTTWAAGWFNKYLVTRLGQYNSDLNEFPHTTSRFVTSEPIVTDYAYSGGAAWHKSEYELNPQLDDTWNEYRGYQTVVATEKAVSGTVITGSSRSVAIHTFYRGMYGDPYLPGDSPASDASSVTTAHFGTQNDYSYLAGREAEVVVKASPAGSSPILRRVDTDYWSSQTAAGSPPVSGDPTLIAAEVQPQTVMTDDQTAAGGLRTHEVVDVHNNATTHTSISNGAVVTHVDAGDISLSPDPGATCTTITYNANTSTYVLVPRLHITYAGTASGASCPGTATLLAETRTYYDNTQPNLGATPGAGNVTCVRVYLTTNASGDCTQAGPDVADSLVDSYDAYGRVTETKDPLGRITQTQYSPPAASGGPLASTKTIMPAVGSLSLNTIKGVNGRGEVTVATDENSRKTLNVYDSLGRLTAVYTPSENNGADPPVTTGPAMFKASYLPSRTAMSRVETQRLVDIVSGVPKYTDSWTYLDGWLRPREMHTVPFGGANHLTTQNRYGDTNEVAAATNPFLVGNGGPGLGEDQSDPATIPLETRYSYDALHRQTLAARTVSGAQSWGQTSTSYYADQTLTTPPAPAPAVTTTLDAWGRKRTSTETAQTGSLSSAMSYNYDPLGRLTSVVDDAGQTNRYTYDLAGRRTASHDADAGDTTYMYDVVGNVTSSTDALNQTVSYTYDALDRPVTIGSGVATYARYDYDDVNKGNELGRLAKTTVTDVASGKTWLTVVDGYDVEGHVLGATATIPTVSGLATAIDYDTTNTYLAGGATASVNYPAIGNLPAETVNYSYETGGGVTGLPTGSTGPFTTTAGYSAYNQLVSRGYTSANRTVTRSYAYGDPLRRMTEVQTVPSATAAAVQDDVYSYDNANNRTQINDQLAADNHQQTCFNYDGLNRLTRAWTTADPQCLNWTNTTALDPAGFNQQYVYAGNGVPTQLVDKGVLSMYAIDTGHPHAIGVVRSGTGTPPLPIVGSYSYDADGQETSRMTGGVSTSMTWDVLHHMSQSVSGSATTRYVYTPDGDRIARQDPDGSTVIWLAGQELRVSNGTVSGTRYYTSSSGATVAMRNSTGLTWLMSDTQNSRQLAIDDATGTATRAYYTPYGSLRSGSGTLPTDQSFLGRVQDPSSGLVQDGARYYDPKLGQFISPDPLADIADNQSLDPFGYAADNPSALSDATGLSPRCDPGQCSSTIMSDYGQSQLVSSAQAYNSTEATDRQKVIDTIADKRNNDRGENLHTVMLCGCLPTDFWSSKWSWQDRWAYFNSGKITDTDIALGYERQHRMQYRSQEERQVAALLMVMGIFGEGDLAALSADADGEAGAAAAAESADEAGHGENTAAKVGRDWDFLLKHVLQSLREDGYAVAETGRKVYYANGKYGVPDGWINGAPLEMKSANSLARGIREVRQYLSSADVNSDVGYVATYSEDGSFNIIPVFR